MASYIDLIKELKKKATEIERKEDIDAVLATIKAIRRGAEVLIVYDKDSGAVSIYDTVLDLKLVEDDRLEEIGNNLYDMLKEMNVVYYLSNEVYSVIGLCTPKN